MKKQVGYEIYTDASFNKELNIATYSIIIISKNKILKTVAKSCPFEINNSTEMEIYGVYQAINVIQKYYISKNEIQYFEIRTDCMSARDFFLFPVKKGKLFDSAVSKKMRKKHAELCQEVRKNGGRAKIRWIPRTSNKIAHKHAYFTLKNTEIFEKQYNEVIISKNAFCKILSEFTEEQKQIVQYLLYATDENDFIPTTQKSIAENLNISIYCVNKTFKNLIQLNIIKKIKNGVYALSK